MPSLEKKFVYIFDLDGVLIEPFGYRKAFEDTLGYFLNPGGLAKWVPAHQIHPLFESLGVTNEWDMVAIVLAVVIDHCFMVQPPENSFDNLAEFIDWSAIHQVDLVDFDVFQKLRTFHTVFHQEGLPSRVLLNESVRENAPYLPALCKHPLLATLLEDTWNIRTSITTAVYQVYSLGSKDFHKTYGFDGPFASPSYLDLYDHVNISKESVKQIQAYSMRGAIWPGMLTLRSSLPPQGVIATGSMYSPEAEKARKLTGLEKVPLMGFGRVYYLSQEFGLPIAQLIKPAMPQALAAILAALSGDEAWSVDVVGQISSEAVLDPNLIERIKYLVGESCSVFVFEDSRVGIQSCISACGWLAKTCEQEIIFRAWGVSTHAEKIETLTKYGASIFADVNAALADSFKLIPELL